MRYRHWIILSKDESEPPKALFEYKRHWWTHWKPMRDESGEVKTFTIEEYTKEYNEDKTLSKFIR